MALPPSLTSSKKWQLVKYWAPVFLYCSIIFYLSSQSHPSQNLPSFLFGLSDKLVHAVEYGILGILLYRAFQHTTHRTGSISLAILGALAFGISDEFHQWFVPHRQADLWDVLADILGSAIFVLAWVYFSKKYHLFCRPQED